MTVERMGAVFALAAAASVGWEFGSDLYYRLPHEVRP